jgi:membrane protein required for beta-lactamase induction
MKFLILLIGLGIERYLNISGFLYRFNWFNSYLRFESKYLQSKNLWRGYIGLAFVVLPILIIISILYYAFAHLLFGFFGFILATLIFIYCLGPKDLYAQLESYFIHDPLKPDGEAQTDLQDLIISDPNPTLSFNRKLSEGMLWRFNQRIFAVSFWFVILGPIGAVLYRLVDLLSEAADQPASQEKEMSHAAHFVLNILDWIPTRLSSLGYALMGNFTKGFSFWTKHCFSGLDKNQEIAIGSGFASLDIDALHESDIEENKAVLGLLDRTLIMYLVLIAVFTLGALAYY